MFVKSNDIVVLFQKKVLTYLTWLQYKTQCCLSRTAPGESFSSAAFHPARVSLSASLIYQYVTNIFRLAGQAYSKTMARKLEFNLDNYADSTKRTTQLFPTLQIAPAASCLNGGRITKIMCEWINVKKQHLTVSNSLPHGEIFTSCKFDQTWIIYSNECLHVGYF